MMRPVKWSPLGRMVSVTAEDIDRGIKGDADYCPVARAVRRACGAHALYVSVGLSIITIIERTYEMREPQYWQANMLSDVRTFIEHFDTGRHVEPFTFTLQSL